MPLNYPNIDSLIANFEGFGTPGVPATVNNNPGNLIAGDFSTSHGAIGQSGPFAIFPDVATGTAAQDALVQHYANQGISLDDLLSKWAPAAAPGNSPAGLASYQSFLSQGLGVPGSTDINTAEKKTPLDSTGSPVSSSTTPDTSGSYSQTSPWSLDRLQQMLGMGPNPVTLSSSNTSASALSFSRIGAFILGFVFIAGGLYLFKPVQETVNTAARGAIAA